MNSLSLNPLASKALPRTAAKRFFLKIIVTTFLFAFIAWFNAGAQTPPPACNLSGSLATIPGSNGEVTVFVEVAKCSPNPKLSYTFDNNSAGSYIKTYGPVVYDKLTHKATQTLTVVPGSGAAGYNLKLHVTTANGSCECSKSVSVNSKK